jgi:hypothetical protein
VSSTCTDVMYFDAVDSIILFSFPSFFGFHRVVPLLQTCFTCKFVHDHVCFCEYACLLDLSSTCERKCGLCFSEAG